MIQIAQKKCTESSFVEKYQRFTKEWNQVASIRLNKGKTFKEAGEVLGTSSSTIIRRFREVAKEQLVDGVWLPKVIAIDEYKGDSDAGNVCHSSIVWKSVHLI